jgi:lipid-binding SYLF domain-containing protein
MLSIQQPFLAGLLAALVALPVAAGADATVKEAEEAVAALKKADPGLGRFFEKAAGHAVFPNVAKGGLVIGGAGGTSYVYEGSKPVGKTTLSQASVGAQVGGQKFSYQPLGGKK